MEKVIAIFDIGKTNKKLLLFNNHAQPVFQEEEKFPVTFDADGFECDDIVRIEQWIHHTLHQLVKDQRYQLKGVNFSTYGASLAFIDQNGERLTPIYNYLKPIDEHFSQKLFASFAGQQNFCRQTASPALGMMLNSGIQITWLKSEHPDVMAKTVNILHFPQYLSYLFTKQAVSECTSIGCHTFMWDFDQMKYHQWLSDAGISLPAPLSNSQTYGINIGNETIQIGIGIHDSSASLVPYFLGSSDPFMLISTGTWCINMNPFNHTPLTDEELKRDCLCYMSINQKPVKASRFFMGHIHDVNVQNLTSHFGIDGDAFKKVLVDELIIQRFLIQGEKNKVFFKEGIPPEYIDNSVDLSQIYSFEEAYHRFIFDLTLECISSVKLVMNGGNDVKKLFVSGGFARNEFFVRLLATFFSDKQVYTSDVDNSSALGAALVIMNSAIPEANPIVNLGLKTWKSF